MKCCFCKKEIEKIGDYTEGNNAEPLREKGRCCNDCNINLVIPARLRSIK